MSGHVHSCLKYLGEGKKSSQRDEATNLNNKQSDVSINTMEKSTKYCIPTFYFAHSNGQKNLLYQERTDPNSCQITCPMSKFSLQTNISHTT